jgi:hypothetical protein
MSEWRPIETAPKDKSVLVAGGTVHYHDDSCFPYEGPLENVAIAYFRSSYNVWVGDQLEGHDNYIEHRPTHWMPLPEPPTPSPAMKL